MSGPDLGAIAARAAAATSGPWRWAGNVDTGDPYLASTTAGLGRRSVLWHVPFERTSDDSEAHQLREYLRDTKVFTGDKEHPYRSYTKAEIEEQVCELYVNDPWGQPRTDQHLVFTHPEAHVAIDARTLAVFEVCPDATERNDQRVYRGDLVGIRNPDADFIAHARQDVDDLLAEVARLRALLGAAAAPPANEPGAAVVTAR